MGSEHPTERINASAATGSDQLLEREEQLAKVEEAIAGAESGSGRGLLVEGPTGIGKTTLLRAAARCAREGGLRVLEARGDEVESGLPWSIAVQLFGEVDRGGAEFAGGAGLAQALFEPGSGPPSASPDPYPILHGLHWLITNAARTTPLLLIVDDAHWGDPQSLRFVNYLAGRIDAMPVSLLVAARAGEPGSGDLLTHLRNQAAVASAPLHPLGVESIRALVAARIPESDAAFGRAVAARVAGNPFLCDQLLREVRAEGIPANAENADRLGELRPEGIGRAISDRLRGLGRDAEALAAAVAILGGAATIDLAGRLASLEEAAAIRSADKLLAADVLALGPRLRFVHPIVGEAVEAQLGDASRSGLHLAAARLLHESESPAEAVAGHLLAAVGVKTEPWAIPVLRQAAAEAMASGAPERAAVLLDRALADVDGGGDAGLYLEAGHAEAALARPRAMELLESSLALAEAPADRIPALASLAEGAYITGDAESAITLGRRALDAIPPGRGGPLEAEILANLSVARVNQKRLEEFRRLLEVPRLGPEGEPTAAEFTRLAVSALDLAMLGRREEASGKIELALPYVQESVEPLPAVARLPLGFALDALGRNREAEAMAERILAEARSAGNQMMVLSGLEARAHARWARGDVVSALADSEVIVEYGDIAMIARRVFRVIVLLEAGQDAEAAATVDLPVEVEADLLGSWGWIWLPYGRAVLHFANCEWEAAAAEAKLAGERLRAIEAVNVEYHDWRPLAARALNRAGRAEEASALARENLEIATGSCSPHSAAVARATLGVIEGGARGADLLTESIAESDSAGFELEAARGRLELGMQLRRRRRPRDARDPLAQAIDIAGRRGARRIAVAAEGELRAAGGRPRRLALTGVGALTPGQRRVAELAGQGLSNREIAQALFLSVKTVESHLTATYTRLQIDSREQLPAALEQRW
jgi:DNA-binding CsgD family transcriptional regulator/DNA polymerase III delta prime subunit